jgi:uncharacterized membrane protein YciS (DUF1049 family)
MRVLRWIIGFALAALAVFFAVTNREIVSIYWSPFHAAVELPLYLIVLGLMATGFIAGGLIVWINTIPIRLSLRQHKKRLRELEKKLEDMTVTPAAVPPPANNYTNNYLGEPAAQSVSPALSYYKG